MHDYTCRLSVLIFSTWPWIQLFICSLCVFLPVMLLLRPHWHLSCSFVIFFGFFVFFYHVDLSDSSSLSCPGVLLWINLLLLVLESNFMLKRLITSSLFLFLIVYCYGCLTAHWSNSFRAKQHLLKHKNKIKKKGNAEKKLSKPTQ